MHIVLVYCGILAALGIADSVLIVNPPAPKRGDFFGSTAAFGKRGAAQAPFFHTTASFGKSDPFTFFENSAGFRKRAPGLENYLLGSSAGFGKRSGFSLLDTSASFGKRDDGFFLGSTASLGRR